MLIFPDVDVDRVKLLVEGAGVRPVICHPSGRPWLVDLSETDVVIASAGTVSVAVIGTTSVTATRLSELASQVRAISDVDKIARALPGSFHLVAAVNGQVRVQGSVSGLRRVYHARWDGIPVAADRADYLARLIDADICYAALAVHVACGLTPPPLGEQSLWSGIAAVPPDRYLVLRPDSA